MTFLAVILSLLVSNFANAEEYRNIVPTEVLFGYEATFQDQEMADEPGVDTHRTRHKEEKLRDMMREVRKHFGHLQTTEQIEGDHKPGLIDTYESGEQLTATMEPGTLEFNLTPKTQAELEHAWKPLYQSARSARLTPSVYYGGELAGGGHFHVGGNTLANNPFLKHPMLLRNVLVYFHQHPSLLYGFMEHNDLGKESTAASYHETGISQGFEHAIQKFDEWVAFYKASQVAHINLHRKLLGLLLLQGPGYLDHYAFINLEDFSWLFAMLGDFDFNFFATLTGFTVEFRNIRPLPTEKHVAAFAKLLLKVMDHLATPGLIVPLEHFTTQDSLNLLSRWAIKADWEVVKNEVGISDLRLDELIQETTDNPHLERQKSNAGVIQKTYGNPKQKKDNIEIVVPDEPTQKHPTVEYKGHRVKARRVQLGATWYRVGVVNPYQWRARPSDCDLALSKKR